MKPNDGCALEVLLPWNDRWVPAAIRRRWFNTQEKRLLANGEMILKDGALVRRYDWQERLALAAIFRE